MKRWTLMTLVLLCLSGLCPGGLASAQRVWSSHPC
jgi:hypothetical protein